MPKVDEQLLHAAASSSGTHTGGSKSRGPNEFSSPSPGVSEDFPAEAAAESVRAKATTAAALATKSRPAATTLIHSF
eukprot:SAG31_NODE_6919_length_1850_cov_1.407196_1_plen_77_part_00